MADAGSAGDVAHLSAAISIILGWATPAGVTAIICAWLGYRHMTKQERREPAERAVGLATLYSDELAIRDFARSVVELVVELRSITRAIDANTAALEDLGADRRDRRRNHRR